MGWGCSMHLGLIVVRSNTKRKAISENGEFEVIIDSLKEAQGLFPLDVVGFKADMLNIMENFHWKRFVLSGKLR